MYYEIFKREDRGRYHYLACRYWESLVDFQTGRPPRVINDFKMQIPAEHQRIRRGLLGGYLHESGVEVLPADVRAFLGSAGVQWERDESGRVVRDANGRWVPTQGEPRRPFLLGASELDPQWVRDRFASDHDSAIHTNLTEYWGYVVAREWEGDRRGTTLNLQVGAGADDGEANVPLATFTNSGLEISVGVDASSNEFSSYARFTGISGLGQATIHLAELQFHGTAASEKVGSPTTRFFAERNNAPTAPTSAVDYDDTGAHPRTTASVDWNNGTYGTGWNTSPSIVSVIQELVNNHDPSAIQIFWEENDAPGADNYYRHRSYDDDTTKAPKLTIDYTSASASWPNRSQRSKRPLFRR